MTTNNLYKNDNLLPYVIEQEEVTAVKKPSVFKRKLNSNELGTLAFMISLSSIIFGIFLVPSIAGICLGVGSLVIAYKKGLKKLLPILSIVISFVTLTLSIWVLMLLVFAGNSEEPTPMIPPGYTYDSTSGIAYAYSPVGIIPCDNGGTCTFDVDLYQAVENQCVDGGTFTPAMQDMLIRSEVRGDPQDFPPLAVGQKTTLHVSLQGFPDGRLSGAGNAYPLNCK